MRALRLVALLLAVSTAECRPMVPFSAEELQAIEEARRAWIAADPCAATALRFPVRRAETWRDLPWADPNGGTVGFFDGRSVWLVPDALAKTPGQHGALRTLAAHELGHALGLVHSMHGLMAPIPRWDALDHLEIPREDAERARARCR